MIAEIKIPVEINEKALSEALDRYFAEHYEDLLPHGEWTQITERSARCSKCGREVWHNGFDRTGKARIAKALYKFCPECGAKMDGGKSDD